ncbi:16S rRNA (cytidine(1402)-2'-O)-methyltransferase [Candidatus Campbellbacteria bacterium RIFOXYC2_FULL_35_25]|uniref:Ribosomal RNA small subunit methyltransferase I n=1 Tax=Candidatus Campbellbacteria bacterium RIFOXYC2_FULL_35_25 TaxID=1797582 RepID=A0A1F5EHT1_9BACT|nr:MAG: 16S rRNA (cytidine(1402)-2'-O)-methyltransferase [Candidatus Campbellbacteria bacterium RIFOXYC2_FULL_35_25]
MSKFYIIGTPIGNLEDMTFRAVRILKEVDLVLCEDTRVTKKLLDKYEIKTPTLSYHQHSKISKIEKIFDLMKEGKNLALVSDAGTPTISDPGSVLVSKIRGEFGNDVEVLVVPGPSALISALSGSGFTADQFLFLGFLPHKKGRETLFKEIAETKRTVAFYESPHRIIKTLNSLNEFVGDRKIMIARELTKIYEEIVSGTAGELLKYFEGNPVKIKGEFVVVVSNK